MSQEARWWTELLIQGVSAIATIAAVIVALRLAVRSEKSRMRISVAEVGWDPKMPEGLRFDSLVTNAGERPLMFSGIGLRADRGAKVLVMDTGNTEGRFGETEVWSVSWSTFESAVSDLAWRVPRWWRVRRRLPRPVWFTCFLTTGEVVPVDLPARTLVRIHGLKPAPDHWLGSATRYPQTSRGLGSCRALSHTQYDGTRRRTSVRRTSSSNTER